MISRSQKEKLQKYLKIDWIPEVLEELKLNNIISTRGKAYSESMIRMVFIGKIEHMDIEQAIFRVFETRKLVIEVYENKKEQLLSRNEE